MACLTIKDINEDNIWAEVKSLAKYGETKELLSILDNAKERCLLPPNHLEDLTNLALTTSISTNKEETALALLDYGANPKLHDHLALRTSSSQGLHKIALKCMEKGADPSTAGGMILALAVSHDQIEATKCILQFSKSAGIDINKLKPIRALEIAGFNANQEIAHTILNYMESLDIQNAIKSMNGTYDTIIKTAKKILTKRHKETLKKVLDREEEITL